MKDDADVVRSRGAAEHLEVGHFETNEWMITGHHHDQELKRAVGLGGREYKYRTTCLLDYLLSRRWLHIGGDVRGCWVDLLLPDQVIKACLSQNPLQTPHAGRLHGEFYKLPSALCRAGFKRRHWRYRRKDLVLLTGSSGGRMLAVCDSLWTTGDDTHETEPQVDVEEFTSDSSIPPECEQRFC
jgi:hypothetical protein